tara:strand:+ start:10 stop:903 length:894 start_codon:yes stop_codon:yes gene_type:complete
MTIPNIPVVGGEGIPFIQVNGTGIKLIQPIRSSTSSIRPIGVSYISDARVWTVEPPSVNTLTVPVTMQVGTPVVNMPGCVKVHKENAKNPQNRNKMLVDDDPKGNTVLCDAGAPYYEPAEYDYRGLTWQTVYTDSEEVPEGVDTGEPPPAPEIEAPKPPDTPGETAEDVECPPPNARRIGDLNQAGTEKVVGYKLTPDGKICETQWEAIGFAEQYLPSVPVVSTTATIALVATSSALLAKPLADLLLKVVKPVIKKVVAKVKGIMGKKEPVLSVRERQLAQRDRNQAIQTLKKAVKK